MGASLLRLHFHDCFVTGCDASILLDATPTFQSEKEAAPNKNSARGFEVIDTIKAKVEAVCGSRKISCADILAVAARDAVVALGGPTWIVELGRRDSTAANMSAAGKELPSPAASLATLKAAFSAKGFSERDLTALSGAHTIGKASCGVFKNRIYSDGNIDAAFAASKRRSCPHTGNGGNLESLDFASKDVFDNQYYTNLLSMKGLLHSDQELYGNNTVDMLVQDYANNISHFFKDFSSAMMKMGSLHPLTGAEGHVRGNCRLVN